MADCVFFNLNTFQLSQTSIILQASATSSNPGINSGLQ